MPAAGGHPEGFEIPKAVVRDSLIEQNGRGGPQQFGMAARKKRPTGAGKSDMSRGKQHPGCGKRKRKLVKGCAQDQEEYTLSALTDTEKKLDASKKIRICQVEIVRKNHKQRHQGTKKHDDTWVLPEKIKTLKKTRIEKKKNNGGGGGKE